MKTYNVKVVYQYESPYSGYSHTADTALTTQARSELSAKLKARRHAEKKVGFEHVVSMVATEVVSMMVTPRGGYKVTPRRKIKTPKPTGRRYDSVEALCAGEKIAVKLKPVWEYSRYRAMLRKNGKNFALVTPDGSGALDPESAKMLVNALNSYAGGR